MKTRQLLVGLLAGVVLVLMLVLVLTPDRPVSSPASAPLAALPDWIATGEGGNNRFGYSVSTAGDVNGKGHADWVIGACGYDDYTGRAYVYLGEGE